METRSSKEIAQRVVGLIASINKVFQAEKTTVWIKENNIERYLSPYELEFIKKDNPTEEDKIYFSWKMEALVPLLWSINGLKDMPALNQQFIIEENEMLIQAVENIEDFLSNTTIREENELIEMEQYLYHQHWRVVDRDLGLNVGKAIPKVYENEPDISDLDSGVVYERRYGMSWVVGHGDCWDDVPTDT